MRVNINGGGDNLLPLLLHEASLLTQNGLSINKIKLEKNELTQLNDSVDDGNQDGEKHTEKALHKSTAPGATLSTCTDDDDKDREKENPAQDAAKRQDEDLALAVRRDYLHTLEKRTDGTRQPHRERLHPRQIDTVPGESPPDTVDPQYVHLESLMRR